jgi:uncharacterized protein (DUF433 family)
MDYQHIITIEPGKRSGKPCIRGTRITVYDILEYLAGGMTETEILEDFSELTSEDIKACFAFAADREKKLVVVSFPPSRDPEDNKALEPQILGKLHLSVLCRCSAKR